MDVDAELPPSSDSVLECALDSDPTNPEADDETVPPVSRPWGSFLTPQADRVAPSTGVGRGMGRNSFGGIAAPSPGLSGPRRVRIEPKWKVTDIIVPLPKEEEVKQEEQGSSIPVAIRRSQVTEEERQVGIPHAVLHETDINDIFIGYSRAPSVGFDHARSLFRRASARFRYTSIKQCSRNITSSLAISVSHSHAEPLPSKNAPPVTNKTCDAYRRAERKRGRRGYASPLGQDEADCGSYEEETKCWFPLGW